MAYIWPLVFLEFDFEYEKLFPDFDRARQKALADGLTGWGNCMAGAEVPNVFGTGMVKIGKILNISPTPDNLQNFNLKG